MPRNHIRSATLSERYVIGERWNAGNLPASRSTNAVDILGFSNGGHVAIEIALRHPALVRKLILASTNISRDGMPPEFWKGMENPKFSDMPQIYKDAFLKVNNDPAALMKMFERDSSRMKIFKGWTERTDQIDKAYGPHRERRPERHPRRARRPDAPIVCE